MVLSKADRQGAIDSYGTTYSLIKPPEPNTGDSKEDQILEALLERVRENNDSGVNSGLSQQHRTLDAFPSQQNT